MRETVPMQTPLSRGAAMIPAAIHWTDMRWTWRAVPAELQALKQWVVWKYELVEGRPDPTKVPYQVNGYHAKSDDWRTWTTFERVCQALDEIGCWDGIGFVFSADDHYCGVDLDHIWQSDADEGIDWGWGLIEKFWNTYAEESPSESGYKIWCRAKLPAQGRKWNMGSGRRIEMFDRGRFFTITGTGNGIEVITDHQDDVLTLIADLDAIEQQKKTVDPVNSFHHHHHNQHHANPHDPRIDLAYQRHYYAERQERHNGLLSTAGWWWKIGIDIEEIRWRLGEFNQSNCHPPKDDPDEIEKILRYVEACPR